MRGSTNTLPGLARHPKTLAAGIGIAVGLALLCGYGDSAPDARQVIVHATSIGAPVAASCIVLLGPAALCKPNSSLAWRIPAQAAIAVAVFLILSRLSDASFGSAVVDRTAPLGALMPPQADRIWVSSFGINAAASLLMLALGEAALQYRHAKAAQILLFLAALGFLLELTGYAARLPAFHGLGALLLGLAGIACVVAAFASTAGSGFLGAFAGATPTARFARAALAASTLGALLAASVLARFAVPSDGILVIGEALVFIGWLWAAGTLAALRTWQWDRARSHAQDALLREATTDGLTGLLSRRKMDELIAEQRRAPARAAMIMIDIDRFRSVNNALGPAPADEILLHAATRLSNLAAPHQVARAGGDEFAILCADLGAAEAHRLGQAVVETIAVPFALGGGRQFHITASVGVAHGATDGVEDLRDAADEAMYIAKTQGGNLSVPFISALHQTRIERIGLEQDLRRACKSDTELFMVYQPIISLRDRRIVAVEALARWQHPRAGLVAPGRFVAIAEASGMFLGLGCKLRTLAVVQAARWRDGDFGRLPIINLNVSPLELARSDVPGTLGALIDRYGLLRSSFCLEVTEGSFADERALQSLRVARDGGFKIAMDDFGVGYSSLTQLPRLPLTSVKLDRSFIDQATESEDGISLLATMVQLAHVLKLPVVAEGVETTEELNIVSDCGCDSVQGFIFSRAMAPAELEPWLRGDHRAQARPSSARPDEAARRSRPV